MLKNYELLYIVHPDLEGTTDKVSEKVTGFITKIGGKIANQEDWGKRKMAYPIAHNDFGVYVLVEFEAESEKLHELERNLRLSEEVMRSMVVSLPEEKEIPAKAKAKKAEPLTDKKAEKTEEAVEEKPEKAEAKEEAVVEEKVEEKEVVKEEKPKKVAAKKEESTEAKIAEDKTKEEDEKDRLKKLDEKLEEILGEDKK